MDHPELKSSRTIGFLMTGSQTTRPRRGSPLRGLFLRPENLHRNQPRFALSEKFRFTAIGA